MFLFLVFYFFFNTPFTPKLMWKVVILGSWIQTVDGFCQFSSVFSHMFSSPMCKGFSNRTAQVPSAAPTSARGKLIFSAEGQTKAQRLGLGVQGWFSLRPSKTQEKKAGFHIGEKEHTR